MFTLNKKPKKKQMSIAQTKMDVFFRNNYNIL